jgi:hypothetical protein
MSSESVDEDNLHISNSGSNGQFLSKQSGDTGGLTWAAAGGGFTLGTEQATTSGSTITFGSIPSGTKMIVISLNGVSTTGTVNPLIRLGDAGGLETSSYVGASVVAYESGNVLGAGDSTGFPIKNRDASTFHCGTVICTLVDSSTFDWVMSVSDSPAGDHGVVGGGRKTLSAELTQVALHLNSTAFDAGSVNIMYI